MKRQKKESKIKKNLYLSKDFLFVSLNYYLTSTVAPASSNLALISSASATEIFSLTTPLASTISLASFNPKPVISLTT